MTVPINKEMIIVYRRLIGMSAGDAVIDRALTGVNYPRVVFYSRASRHANIECGVRVQRHPVS